MSKKTSLLVSAMGVLTGFGTAFAAAFKKRGGTDEDLHQLLVGLKSEDFISQITDLAMKMTGAVRDGFHIIVDYAKTLDEMIRAGAYDWVNSNITSEYFPVKGEGRVELNAELVHYGKFMSSDSIVQDMGSHGLRPGTLAELLAFGGKYPEKQREFPIVALGSVWRDWHGDRFVAFLHCYESRRELDLGIWEGGWGGRYRFLAFRK